MGTANLFPLKRDVASATKVLKSGKVLKKKKQQQQKKTPSHQPIVMENDTWEQMYHVAMAA